MIIIVDLNHDLNHVSIKSIDLNQMNPGVLSSTSWRRSRQLMRFIGAAIS